MEQGPEEIKRELQDPVGININSESIPEMMESENSVEVVVANETLLVRMVPDKYVRKDQTVTSDAFRPKPKNNPPTNLEKNVSTSPRTCFKSSEDLRKYKDSRRKHMLFQIKAQFPNECNYPAIQDKACHIGITGDMVKLSTDEKTLQILAYNSTLLYPVSTDL